MGDLWVVGPGEPFWVAVGAVAQVVLAIGVPATVGFAYWTERRERRAFQQDERDKFYAQLDLFYFEILKMIAEKPYFSRYDRPRTPEQKEQYDVFALIMWNFIESIYDYSKEGDVVNKTSPIYKTWHCILVSESDAHGGWFNVKENQQRFKPAFVAYIHAHNYSKKDGPDIKED